jgi:predicted homoserine dehydrogenase-like protein
MNLFAKLLARKEAGTPVRVGLIGAGKFGSMFLAQARKLPAIHIAGIADLSPERARANLAFVDWKEETYHATHLDDACAQNTTFITDDASLLIADERINIIIEATGDPLIAVDHIIAALDAGKDVINVTVEADAFCGPGLARRAEAAGQIYSMAYGDQPALVCDLVDWARTCGFSVMAAGRGHKWMPHYRLSTPETVWDHWGLTKEQAERGRLNPKMFNAFLDGSKPAIESAAIANACRLTVPEQGLVFPSGSVDDIPQLMRPKSVGGVLDGPGMVEVISSLMPDGEPIAYDIRKGVWVCIEADTDYIKNCFEEYKVTTDDSGKYSCLYKRWHLIGLELGMSVASVAVRGEATGVATCFNADVAAVAKSSLPVGTVLDGEGGATIYGGLRPAATSVAAGYLPLGLANKARLTRPVSSDQVLTWDDVELDTNRLAFQLRRETEALLD